MPSISIDLFGNLDKKPTFWKELLAFVKEEGIKVFVIGGPFPTDILQKLGLYGYIKDVHYDKVHSVLSHLSRKGIGIRFDEDQDCWYSDYDARDSWWSAKSEICQLIGSQTHFDNDLRFGPYFENVATRFVHTLNQKNMKLIDQWHKDLKLANTYEDWDDATLMMGGFVPM